VIKFIIRKLFYGLLVLYGVITVVFFLFNIKEGDPSRMMGGQHMTEEIRVKIRKDLGLDLPLYKRYLLYLNDLSPFSIHNTKNKDSYIYLDQKEYEATTLFSVGSGRTLVMKAPYLRRSYQKNEPVADIIREAMPGTFILAITSIILATVIGIIMGVIAAIYKGTFFDNSMFVGSVLGMSAPSFFMAIIIQWMGGLVWFWTTNLPQLPFYFLMAGALLGIVLNKRVTVNSINKNFSYAFLVEMIMKGLIVGLTVWMGGLAINGFVGKEVVPFIGTYFFFPGTNLPLEGSLYNYDNWTAEKYLALENLILPALTLGIRPLAIVMQLTRSSLLDVLSQDYIRTATAKGLSFYKVIVKHGLKNALNPVITAISGWFASLLAGAVFIEMIFNWHGIGFQVFDAVVKEDLPVVIGSVLVISTIFVVINIFVDIIYGFLDPRVRIQ
jgi:ABC-type dipeptide/oligopeptide/nickel transport system permease component